MLTRFGTGRSCQLALAVAVAALGVIAASACGLAGGGGQAGAEAATTGEAATAIYVNSRYHYKVDAPGQMKEQPDGTASVIGPSERLQIAVIHGPQASDPAALASGDVTSLPGSTTSFRLVSGPAAITLNSKQVQRFVYSYNAGTSDVTGKSLDLVGVRYYIPRDSSTIAVLSYAIVSNQFDPQGADDLAGTFAWQ